MQKASKLRSIAIRIIELSIAGVLFWSGVEHLRNSFAFLTSLLRYQLVSGHVAVGIATILPVFQTVLAGTLVLGLFRRQMLVVAATLLTVFAIVQSIAYVRGLEIGCGCFGAGNDTPIDAFSIARVSILAAFAWIAFCFQGKETAANIASEIPVGNTAQTGIELLQLETPR